MENKKKYHTSVRSRIIAICMLLLLVLTIVFYVNCRPIKINADTDVKYIQVLNDGFDLYYNTFMLYNRSSNYVANEHVNDGINPQVYFSTNYFYYRIPLGSDTPTYYSIFGILYLDCMTPDVETYLLPNRNVFELGFLNGTSDMDGYQLKYQLKYYDDIETGSYVMFFVDLSDEPIYSEGSTYCVLRFKKELGNLFVQSTQNKRCLPNLVFTTLNVNESYDTIYQQAFNEGLNSGFSQGQTEGYTRGYTNGYTAGSLNPSQDYHIGDLLFSIFDAPYQVLYNMFSFTIFGTTFWTIIVSLLTLLIVLWVIKRFIS